MTLDPGSRILDPESKSLDPGAWIQELGSRSLDPGAWIQDPGSRDPGSRTLDPGLEITDALFEYSWKHVKQQMRYLNKTQAAEAWFEKI